jgi:hypothetical protein
VGERVIADVIVAAFYLGILYAIYRRVRKKRHPTRSQWKSFVIVLGSIALAIFIGTAVFLLAYATLEVPRHAATPAFVVGLIAVLVIKAWRWSMARIQTAASE